MSSAKIMTIASGIGVNKMDEYTVKSVCKDCGCEEAVVLYHMCDKMSEPDHIECSDECNPEEMPFIPGYHNRERLDTFLRCKSCGSLNTEKQIEW